MPYSEQRAREFLHQQGIPINTRYISQVYNYALHHNGEMPSSWTQMESVVYTEKTMKSSRLQKV